MSKPTGKSLVAGFILFTSACVGISQVYLPFFSPDSEDRRKKSTNNGMKPDKIDTVTGDVGGGGVAAGLATRETKRIHGREEGGNEFFVAPRDTKNTSPGSMFANMRREIKKNDSKDRALQTRLTIARQVQVEGGGDDKQV